MNKLTTIFQFLLLLIFQIKNLFRFLNSSKKLSYFKECILSILLHNHGKNVELPARVYDYVSYKLKK